MVSSLLLSAPQYELRQSFFVACTGGFAQSWRLLARADYLGQLFWDWGLAEKPERPEAAVRAGIFELRVFVSEHPLTRVRPKGR